MKNLNIYIEELLYRHQCVIAPDFGAFVSNRKAAELTQDNTFSPPQKELTFNSRLTYNDGLVAKYISEVEKISYEEAQEYIKSVVTEWKEILNAGGEVVFDNIGSFHMGTSNNIVFEPAPKENFLTDSFGMSSFQTHQVEKDEQNSVNPVLETDPDTIIENPLVTPQEAAAGKPKRKLPSIIKYAAVAIVGLSAISYGAFMLLNKQSNNEIVQVTPDPEVVKEKVKEYVSQASFFNQAPREIPGFSLNSKKDPELVKKRQAEEKARQKEEQKRLKEEAALAKQQQQQAEVPAQKEKSTTTPKTSTTKVSGKYHLIAGAFSTEQNANNRIKQLRKDGYSESMIVGKNARGLFLVSYKSFETESDANTYKQELKGKGIDTWVYNLK